MDAAEQSKGEPGASVWEDAEISIRFDRRQGHAARFARQDADWGRHRKVINERMKLNIKYEVQPLRVNINKCENKVNFKELDV